MTELAKATKHLAYELRRFARAAGVANDLQFVRMTASRPRVLRRAPAYSDPVGELAVDEFRLRVRKAALEAASAVAGIADELAAVTAALTEALGSLMRVEVGDPDHDAEAAAAS